MEAIQYKVQEYEGPLDLILQLIQKHKLDILDIEITALLEQYMTAIRQMQEGQLEIASEFLEMASYLVYIKSSLLLPRHQEEEKDPRKELTGALLEYQACKRVAEKLRERQSGESRFVRSGEEVEIDMTYELCHRPVELLRAYFGALGRGKRKLPPPPAAFSGIVSRRMVSVSSRIAYVLNWLYKGTALRLYELFSKSEDRPELVATFLAVLELIRDQRVLLEGDSDIKINKRAAISVEALSELEENEP